MTHTNARSTGVVCVESCITLALLLGIHRCEAAIGRVALVLLVAALASGLPLATGLILSALTLVSLIL